MEQLYKRLVMANISSTEYSGYSFRREQHNMFLIMAYLMKTFKSWAIEAVKASASTLLYLLKCYISSISTFKQDVL